MTSSSERPEQAADDVAGHLLAGEGEEGGPPPEGGGPLSVRSDQLPSLTYFSDVNVRSQFALNLLITPATSADAMFAWLSQMYGIAGACS